MATAQQTTMVCLKSDRYCLDQAGFTAMKIAATTVTFKDLHFPQRK